MYAVRESARREDRAKVAPTPPLDGQDAAMTADPVGQRDGRNGMGAGPDLDHRADGLEGYVSEQKIPLQHFAPEPARGKLRSGLERDLPDQRLEPAVGPS